MEMQKTYNPQEFEEKHYKNWEKKGYFTPHPTPDKKPYTIVIPPPNITGRLHMGHALNNSIQDAIIRFKRMQGYSALYLPGTDHASIATEVKIVEQMEKEGLSKKSLGRSGFLERAWKWKEEYGGSIIGQLKKLGCSCDWSRLAFTMDEKCSKAVKQVFVNLYNKGLIYQGNRIINWCPDCKTALSDAEVDYAEKQSHLWHLRYPYKDGSGYIVVATTRPETMLGDTAVAVNPQDKRYKDKIGKMLVLPLTNREIPVIADDYVDKEYGTGAVKITPAHDPNDFEVGKRHNLKTIRVIADDGKMNELAGSDFVGLDRLEARKEIIRRFEELGLLEKIEPLTHNVGHCYRCSDVVEPIVSLQWFVKMEPLAKPAIESVREGDVNFIPKRFEKIYFNWMENIKDWCISRQLWWGHRIPAFYCKDCGRTVVTVDEITKCPDCGGKVVQDEDVLDTWFSSALWPFSTLGWPDKTQDLEYFYPTDVLVTAYDIIFFWVARMIFSGLEHMDICPFKDVLITGLVRDAQGRKMSKSLGNGIDPLELIDKYGADTLRFSLLNGIAPGGDTRFSEEKVEGCRNFVNKLWNASRFVLMNAEGKDIKPIDKCSLTTPDKWILTELNEIIKETTANMEKYELGLAGSKLYDFVWSEFCDWYIELCKPVLYGEDSEKRTDTVSVLIYVLDKILKLLHPFIPFITEEIYLSMPIHGESIMTEDFPTAQSKLCFKQKAEEMNIIREIIKAVRNTRAELNVPPSKRTNIRLVPIADKCIFEENSIYLTKFAYAEKLEIVEKSEISGKNTSIILPYCEIYIASSELIDIEKETTRLNSEIKTAKKELALAESKLANVGFTAKAPQALIDAEIAKKEKYSALIESLTLRLEEVLNS